MARKNPHVNVAIEYGTYQELQIVAASMGTSVTKLVNKLLNQAISAAKVGLGRDEL